MTNSCSIDNELYVAKSTPTSSLLAAASADRDDVQRTAPRHPDGLGRAALMAAKCRVRGLY